MDIRLSASDGHQFDAYVAEPDGAARAAIVVIQEIFGVNSHIRQVADGYAAAGYLAVAPALYDRSEPGIELGYEPDDIQTGLAHRGKVELADTLSDIAAAAVEARRRAAGGKVGAVGYCWGGYLATATAQQLAGTVDAAVGYYGGGTASLLDAGPSMALLLHFGERDHAIPLSDVDKVRQAWPDVAVHVYAGAQHGFNCDQRASHHAPAARLALSRTLRFFFDQLG
jgi:carboxymethylenebutenolidase